MVDIGVTVALPSVGIAVAGDFFLTHGVQTVPFQQQADGIGREHGIAVARKEDAALRLRPVADDVVVAGRHVEIGAGKIALVLVIGLKHDACITCMCAGSLASLGNPLAVSQAGATLTDTVGVVGTLVVHIAVGWHNVEDVAVLILLRAAPPALGHTVLAVDAVTYLAVIATLVTIGVLVIVAVHVDVVAAGIGIGVGIGIPQAVIADVGVARDDVVQCSEQGFSAHVQRVRIVVAGTGLWIFGIRSQCQRHHGEG